LVLKVDPQTLSATQFVVGMETTPPGATVPTHRTRTRRRSSSFIAAY